MDNARRLGIDAMIVIGGDATQHIARDFARKGVNIVGVPKAIDNDLDATEVRFGFDTALAIATEAVDRLHTMAESHHRVMLIDGTRRGLDCTARRNRGRDAYHFGARDSVYV